MQRKTNKILARLAILFLLVNIFACSSTPEKKSSETADIYLQLGERYLSMNRLETSKENLEKALSLDSNNVRTYIAMAYLYEKIEKFSEASDYYEKAYSLAPEDLAMQNNYGRFLCTQKKYDQGMELLTKAMTNLLNDKQWLALTNAGICELNQGQKGKAKTYFKQALQLNENYTPALLEMLKISYQNSEFWPAKAYLDRYLGAAQHTSETLWYGMQIERALGHQGLATEYENLLVEKFPLSKEAKKIGVVRH